MEIFIFILEKLQIENIKRFSNFSRERERER